MIAHLFQRSSHARTLGEGDVPEEMVDSLVMAAVESNARLMVDDRAGGVRRCALCGHFYATASRYSSAPGAGTGRTSCGRFDFRGGLHELPEPDLARAG